MIGRSVGSDANPLSCFLFRPRKRLEKRRKRSHINASNASVIRTSRVSQTPLQTPLPCFHASINEYYTAKNGLGTIAPRLLLRVKVGTHLGSLRKIAHKGLHAETGAFPSAITVRLCAASEIPFIPPCFYIHTFPGSLWPLTIGRREKVSEDATATLSPTIPHCVFQLRSQMAHVRFHRRKRVHTRLSEKDRTQRLTRRNRWRFGWGWYHYPRSVPHVSETLRGRGLKRQTLPLLGLGRGCSQRTQRAFGTAMRLCASLFRGVAAPLGCVIFLFLTKLRFSHPVLRAFRMGETWDVSLPSAHFTCC